MRNEQKDTLALGGRGAGTQTLPAGQSDIPLIKPQPAAHPPQ